MRHNMTMYSSILLIVLIGMACEETRVYGPDDGYEYVEGDAGFVGTGIYTDYNNSIQWQQTATEQTFNFNEAEIYCNALELGEFTDWRLPKLNELRLLLACGATYQCILNDDCGLSSEWSRNLECGYYTPMTSRGCVHLGCFDAEYGSLMRMGVDGPLGRYWSRYRYDGYNVFTVDFVNGVIAPTPPEWPLYVRCVRDTDI